MKNVSLTMSLVALLLASGVKAADVTIKWQGTARSIGTGYLPKSASDGLVNVATVIQTGKGLNVLQYKFGWYEALTTPPSVSWPGLFNALISPPQTTAQIGHSPSIGLILEGEYPNAENAIEVHQGGQDNESLLWYQLGSTTSVSSGMNWLTSLPYDTGYNATVARPRTNSQKFIGSCE